MKVQFALSTAAVATCLSAFMALAAPNPGAVAPAVAFHKRFSPGHNFGGEGAVARRGHIAADVITKRAPAPEPEPEPWGYGYRGGRWIRKSRTRSSCPTSSSSASGSTTSPPAADPAPTEGGGGEQPVPENPAPAPAPSSSAEAEAPAPSVPAAEPEPEPAPAPAPPTNQNPVAQEYLTAHNNERANHGAQPLTWSDELAGYAQNWVNQCKWQHSSGPYGENLSMGTNMGPAWAVQLWLDERTDYNPANPQYSHWTQVVWKGSQQLGCASQTCGNMVMHACEYYPPGNYIGQFPQNVQP